MNSSSIEIKSHTVKDSVEFIKNVTCRKAHFTCYGVKLSDSL